MRTFFDIVLGILFTVLKTFLHALVSTAGALAMCALVVFVAVYSWRRVLAAHRRSASAEE